MKEGGQIEAGETDGVKDDAPSGANVSVGIYKTAGSELSEFFTAFHNATGAFEGPVSKLTTDDFELFDVGMDYLSPGIQIASIGLYDSLEVFGKNRGEYRESKGNVITFGMNYTMEEDGFSPDDKKGDVVVEKGSLDTSDNTLLHEI